MLSGFGPKVTSHMIMLAFLILECSHTYMPIYWIIDHNAMASASNSSASSPDQTITICAEFLNAFELCVQLVAFLISAFNFTLLYTTALLHPNLKGILLVQSTVIGLVEILRAIFVMLKFVCADPFFHGAFPLQLVSMPVIWFRNLMGHVLMAERVFATIDFRAYADKRSKCFTVCWVGILLAISIWYTYVQQGVYYSVNFAAFATACILFALGVAEILSLATIYLYNLGKYKNEFYLTLNERFQLSENIRTAKQLTPTIFLHFLNANALNLVTFLIYFGILVNGIHQSLAYLLLNLVNSVACSCIEITVITHHPMIKRKAAVWLKKHLSIFTRHSSSARRVRDASMTTKQNRAPNLVDIHGRTLHTESEPAIYFQRLREEWQ